MATSTAIDAEAKKAPQLACSMVMLRAIAIWITASLSLVVATSGQKKASHWWMKRHCLRFARRDQQMHVIGHQGVGMQMTVGLLERDAQPVQIGVIIFLGIKAGLTVVAPLHDVERYFVEMDARTARNERRVRAHRCAGFLSRP